MGVSFPGWEKLESMGAADPALVRELERVDSLFCRLPPDDFAEQWYAVKRKLLLLRWGGLSDQALKAKVDRLLCAVAFELAQGELENAA